MIRLFRFLLGFSIVLFLVSAYLSGIKYEPIINGTELIDRGYREIFIYLVLAAIVMAAVYWLTFAARLDRLTVNIKIGMIFCIVAMIATGIAIIFCDWHALNNAPGWSDSEIIFALVAFPATFLFFIGIGVVFYGWYEEKRKNGNDAQ